MKDEEVREKTAGHYREMVKTMPQYAPTRMAELAPGVIAVEDKSGECDALFDTERWKFVRPELWGDHIPKMLNGTGLNVLQGVGRVPNITTIKAMMEFAKQHLASEMPWHDTPQFFNFE